VANSLAGVRNGARQVECTVNGIGERAGNAAMEEVVMAIRTRQDVFDIDTGINATEFCRASRMVADLLGFMVPPNKAVVGDNAFAHSSGIHVDGVLKKRETYEIMKPEDVGAQKTKVVLTARTGRHGLRHRLEEMGYSLSNEELDHVYEHFLLVADKKKEVFDEDLAALIGDEVRQASEQFRLRVQLRFARKTASYFRRLPAGTDRWMRRMRPSVRRQVSHPSWTITAFAQLLAAPKRWVKRQCESKAKRAGCSSAAAFRRILSRPAPRPISMRSTAW
jgi:isopropylmalate/homocitrate/citramalate synthase